MAPDRLLAASCLPPACLLTLLSSRGCLHSRIRHAISTTGPAGPYKAHDVSFPVWGHEPTVARAPTGEYAMFWSASFGKDVPCSRVQCPNGDNGNSVIDGEQCLPDTDCVYRPPMRSYMAYAAGPAGPWSAPQLVASPEGEEVGGYLEMAAPLTTLMAPACH